MTWLDSNQRSYIWIFGWTLREDVRLASVQTTELFFELFFELFLDLFFQPTIKFPRKTNKKECIIGLLNVNSLPSKFIEIKEWLVDGVFDILCIQETKIDSTFPNSQFHVNGYNIFRRDRKKGGGGVMILYVIAS